MSSKISTGYSGSAYTVPTGIPSGRCCGRINNFIIIGALTTNRNAVQWCAVGDPSDWPTPATDDARSKQAGLQAMPPQYGPVTGIASGDFFGYVFQERAITKATYVGGDVVFAFDTFEEDRGCVRVGMLEQIDDLSFFKSDRGYHILENGQIADVGFGAVDDQ
jgi:hypothetical protein